MSGHTMQVVLMFVAGNLIATLVAYGFLRVMRREPRLLDRRERIFELNRKPLRIESGEAELAASKSERSAIRIRIDRLDDRRKTRVPLDDPPSTRVAYGLLGAILAEGEAAVFVLLTAPAAMFGLSPEVWAFAAPPISAAGVLALHVVAGGLLTDKHRPARTVRRAKLGAAAGGILVIVAVWMVLSGRTLTDAVLVEAIVGWGLTALAGVLSVTAAMCTLVASTLVEAEQEEHELARLARRAEAYDRHIRLIEHDMARLSSESAEPTAAIDVSGGRANATRVAAVLLMLALGGSADVAKAQAAPAQDPRPASMPFARRGACEWLVDITPSLGDSTDRVLGTASAQMSHVARIFNCKVARVTTFAGSLIVRLQEFPLSALDSVGCQATDPSGAKAKAIEIMYPTVAREHQTHAVATCSAERQSVMREAESRRAEEIRPAAIALSRAAARRQGPCTALLQAVKRAAERSQYLFVITDGESSCPASRAPVSLSPEGLVVLLLLPSAKDSTAPNPATLISNRIDRLRAALPGAVVLLAPEATLSQWKAMADEYSSGPSKNLPK